VQLAAAAAAPEAVESTASGAAGAADGCCDNLCRLAQNIIF
jgi:hypothetical protein